MMSSKKTGNEDKIIRTPNLDYTPDPRGVGYVFFTYLLKHKDKVGQIDGLTGEKDKFSSVLQRCVRTAITLRSKGITPDDIVALCTYSHLDSCVPFISTLFLAAKVASVDPDLSLAENTELLKQIKTKIIFVVPEAVEMIEKVIEKLSANTEIVVFGPTTKHTPFADFLKPCDGEDSFKPTEPKSLQDIAMILFSSGTSGLPKGICINQYTYLGQIYNAIDFGYDTDVILTYTSFFWISSSIFGGISIINGTARLLLPRFDPAACWWIIDKYKPTVMFLGPNEVLMLYNAGRPKNIDTSSLKDISVGGGPMLEVSMRKAREVLPDTRVCLTYGQTEAAGYITCFKPSSPEDMKFVDSKPASSGPGIPGMSFKVVNPKTEELLGPYQQGELRIKSDLQLSGYHNRDSSSVWDSDGYLKTGDVVYYDDDHCFFVVDRIKEILKFQMWHIPPVVLENLLVTHPDIKRACVIGIPHEVDGDHPMAIVLLKDPSKNVTPEEIIKFVEDRVDDKQRLRGGVKIVDSIPTTPTGKIKRRLVKEKYGNPETILT